MAHGTSTSNDYLRRSPLRPPQPAPVRGPLLDHRPRDADLRGIET